MNQQTAAIASLILLAAILLLHFYDPRPEPAEEESPTDE